MSNLPMRAVSSIAASLLGTRRNRVFAASAIVAISLGALTWEQTRPEMPPTIRVTGTVVTPGKFPLAGTTVQLSVPDYDQDETTHTDEHGRFELRHVHRGHIELRFHRSGYRDQQVEVPNRVTPLNEDVGSVVLTAGGPASGPAFPIVPGGPKLPIQTTLCEVKQNPDVFDRKLVSLDVLIARGPDVPAALLDHSCEFEPLLKIDDGDRGLHETKGFVDYRRIAGLTTIVVSAKVTGVFGKDPQRFGINMFPATFELRSISHVVEQR